MVDDDPDILEALCEILETEGFGVRQARNGWEALQLLEPLPDVILLDLMMPVMDGSEFAERMRRGPRWARIPVIVLSADRNISSKAREVGAVAYLAKPFELSELLRLVRTTLTSSAPRHGKAGSSEA